MSTKSKKYVCPFRDCLKSFSKPSRLRHHEMTHTGERPYTCTVADCDKSYTRAAHLKRHTEVAHGTPRVLSWDVWCEEDGCDAMFTSTEALNKHVTKQHKEPPSYKCPEEGCTESFRKHHQLRAHRYTHQGVLPFQCAEPGCLRRFAQKSHLDRHKKQHEGYRCQTSGCTATFSQFSQLRKHNKICHTPDALCPECGKTFHSVRWLTQHLLTHADTRTTYKCPHDGCPRAYLAVRNLTAHVRAYHDNREFVCDADKCGRAFSTKQKLKQHQKLHVEPSDPQEQKKYPKKGHRKKDFLTRLTGVPKSQVVTIETMDEADTEVTETFLCQDKSETTETSIGLLQNTKIGTCEEIFETNNQCHVVDGEDLLREHPDEISKIDSSVNFSRQSDTFSSNSGDLPQDLSEDCVDMDIHMNSEAVVCKEMTVVQDSLGKIQHKRLSELCGH